MDEYLDIKVWRKCYSHLQRIVQVLDAHPNIVLGNIGQIDMADMILAQVRVSVRARLLSHVTN